jgi:hypothetical protein
MAAIDFPDSPANNDVFASGTRTWKYDGVKGLWKTVATSSVTNLVELNTDIIPNANVTYDLGSTEKAFKDLYLSGNTLVLGTASITSTESGTIALPAGTTIGSEPGVSNTELQAVLANTNAYIASVDTAKLETTDVDYSISLTQQGTLAVTTGTARWYAPYNLATNSIKAYVETAPVGSAISITVNKNGTSAATPSISAGATSATEITTPITMSEGDYLTVDITAVGSTTAGENLNIVFKYKRT